MSQSFGRRIVVSLLVGVVTGALFVVPDLLRGLSWQELGPAWVHFLRVLSGAIGWFMADLVVRGLNSLRRRQA